MANLAGAVKAYRASVAAVEAAQRAAEARVRAARARQEEKRLELAAAIVEAALSGMRQVEIIAETGYSRERVRTILRAGGVEPD